MTDSAPSSSPPRRRAGLLFTVAAGVLVTLAGIGLVQGRPSSTGGGVGLEPSVSASPMASARSSETQTHAPSVSTSPSAVAAPSMPDGLTGTLAYVGHAEDPQIFLLELATGESSQLTELTPEHGQLTGDGTGLRPALSCWGGPSGLTWSPDGSMLAFSYGGCESVIYTVELDGTLHRIGDGGAPSWSPDGGRLVFQPNIPYAPCGVECLDPSRGPWELLVANPRGQGDPVALTRTEATFTPSRPLFSPDGSLIAFTGPSPNLDPLDLWSSAAFVVDADGRNPRHVVDGGYATGWAPDGRLIASLGEVGESLLVDLATGDTEHLDTGTAGGPWLSPLGDVLLVAIYEPMADETTIELLAFPGRQLLATAAGDTAAWAPDGAYVAVVDADVTSTVRMYAADGSSVGEFVVDGWVGEPAWRP